MKLFSKEALLLGGIYGLYSFPLTFFEESFVADLLIFIMTIVFLVSMIRLLFNNVPKFVTNFLQKHPRLSIYLIASGWFFYFIWVFLAVVSIGVYGGYFYEGSPAVRLIEKYGENFSDFILVLLGLSLLGAAVYDYRRQKALKLKK